VLSDQKAFSENEEKLPGDDARPRGTKIKAEGQEQGEVLGRSS